jgi:hypothetical protein
MKEVPLMMMAVGLFDHHLAADDAGEALLQLPHMLLDVFLDRLRAVEVPELNLKRCLHDGGWISEKNSTLRRRAVVR